MPDVDNVAIARAILGDFWERQRREFEARIRMLGIGHRYHPYRDCGPQPAPITRTNFRTKNSARR